MRVIEPLGARRDWLGIACTDGVCLFAQYVPGLGSGEDASAGVDLRAGEAGLAGCDHRRQAGSELLDHLGCDLLHYTTAELRRPAGDCQRCPNCDHCPVAFVIQDKARHGGRRASPFRLPARGLDQHQTGGSVVLDEPGKYPRSTCRLPLVVCSECARL